MAEDPGKRRRSEGGSGSSKSASLTDEVQKLVIATAKELMTTSFMAKTAFGILIANWFLLASHRVAVDCQRAAVEHTAKTKGSKGHSFGIPDY